MPSWFVVWKCRRKMGSRQQIEHRRQRLENNIRMSYKHDRQSRKYSMTVTKNLLPWNILSHLLRGGQRYFATGLPLNRQ